MSTRRLLLLPLLAALACSTDPEASGPNSAPATACEAPAQLLAHVECSFSPTADVTVRFDRQTYNCARVTDQAEVKVAGQLLGASAVVLCPGDSCPPIEVKGYTVSLGAELKVVRAAPAGSWTSPAAASCR
jgi:hypothetical protein